MCRVSCQLPANSENPSDLIGPILGQLPLLGSLIRPKTPPFGGKMAKDLPIRWSFQEREERESAAWQMLQGSFCFCAK